jgi:hypothetical protein
MNPNDILRAASLYYLKTNASTGEVLTEPGRIYLPPHNLATPIRMQPLIDRLAQLTVELTKSFPKSLPPGTEQVGLDFAAWAQRLAGYQILQAVALDSSPTVTTQGYWDGVVRPLLLGIYPGDAAQQVADLVTPYTIGNQLDIIEASEADRSTRFWSDLDGQVRRYLDTASDVLDRPTESPQLMWALFGGAVALGALYYVTR